MTFKNHLHFRLHKSQGFTLIELIIVIVILGILSIVAAPKFIDISTEARIASLMGINATLKSVNAMIESKTMIDGVFNNKVVNGVPYSIGDMSFTLYDGGTIRELWYGGFEQVVEGDYDYIGNTASHINVDCENASICVVDNVKMDSVIPSKVGYGIFFFPKGYSVTDNCHTYYTFRHDYEVDEHGSVSGTGSLVSKEVVTDGSGC